MAIALSVAFTATPLAAGAKLVIEATRQVSNGISFMPRSEYKKVFVGAGATASPANILAGYNAIFGVLVAGTKIFIRSTPFNASGFPGTPLYSVGVVA